MSASPFSLESKRILITGGASGIGKATALLCAQMGADVVLVDLNEQGLKQTAEEIGKESTEFHALNLTNEEQLEEMISSLPKLDGVVSNAGIVYSLLAKFNESKDMERIFNINTFSHINLIQGLI